MNNLQLFEIDEQVLQARLKGLDLPLKSDAWHKFEVYSDVLPLRSAEKKAGGFDFRVNRQVMMPAVFGLVIVLLSFLLYNFISIDADAATAGEITVVTAPPVVADPPAEQPIAKTEPAPAQEIPVPQTAAPAKQVIATQAAVDIGESLNPSVATNTVRKARKKVVEEVEIEPLPVQQPMIIVEDKEPELRLD